MSGTAGSCSYLQKYVRLGELIELVAEAGGKGPQY